MALLAGKPLLVYAIESALESQVFDEVCVSSEDPEILEMARSAGARPLERARDLATDRAQVKDVCADILRDFTRQGSKYAAFGVLLTTNPLRTSRHIREAYRIFEEGEADSVMSVVPMTHPPHRAVAVVDGRVRPYFGIEQMKRTQDLPRLYRHDGTVIFARTDAFLDEMEFYGESTAPYHVAPGESVDIDEPVDLEWAAFLLSRSARPNGPEA